MMTDAEKIDRLGEALNNLMQSADNYIEAKDDDEALTIAEGMDGAEFTNTEHGDWEIYSVEEASK